MNKALTQLLVCSIVLLPAIGISQVSPAHYFSETNSQNSHYNPAFTCEADFFLGVPFLTSFNMEARNSFKYNDYIIRENDSLWASPANLVSSLNAINYSSVINSYDLIYLGFRKANHYFRIGLRNHITSFNTYSDKMASLFLLGNAQFIGQTTSFKNNYSLTNIYQEYYLSYTHTFAGKFSIGITPKFLTGVFNTWTEEADFELSIDENNFSHFVRSDFNIHTSSPLPNTERLSDRIKQLPWIQFADNTGYALDIGASYTVNKKLQLALSVTDIGKIHWNKNVKSFSGNSNEAVPFEGLDLSPLFDQKKYKGATPTDMVTQLAESFNLKESKTAYTAPLSTKAFFSGAYRINEIQKIGILTYAEKYHNKWIHSYAINYSRKMGNWLLASVNYNYNKPFQSSLGIAFEIQTDEFQIIFETNNIYGLFNLDNTKTYHLQIGLGWQISK